MCIENTWEGEIRVAFHRKWLKRQHNCSKTIVIDELGLAHGKQRIDIAVLNGTLHGYEIKSSKDTLGRLEQQLSVYESYFEKLSIVTAENHLSGVLELSPKWSEIIILRKGKRGGIHFSQYRKACKNPNININSVLHLLWRKEALDFIEHLGLQGDHSKKTRVNLYEAISEEVSFEEVLSWTKSCFNSRKDWRSAR